MKRFLIGSAVVCLLTWAVWAGVIALRMKGATEDAIPTWLGSDSFLVLALDAVRAAAMVICWVGSVYAWSRIERSGVVHGAALVMLVFLGAVFGPFYILLTAKNWSRRANGGPAGAAGSLHPQGR